MVWVWGFRVYRVYGFGTPLVSVLSKSNACSCLNAAFPEALKVVRVCGLGCRFFGVFGVDGGEG